MDRHPNGNTKFTKINHDPDKVDKKLSEFLDGLQCLPRSRQQARRRNQPQLQRSRSCPDRDSDGSVISLPPRKKPCRISPGDSSGSYPSQQDMSVTEPAIPAVDPEIELHQSLAQELLEQGRHQSWHTRRHKVLGQWDDVHHHFVQCLINSLAPKVSERCSLCPETSARIMCISCPGIQMCHSCDKLQHLYQPLHDRMITIDNMYRSPLPCDSALSSDDVLEHHAKYIPVLKKDATCPECRSCEWTSSGQGYNDHLGQTIIITLKGRYDAYLPYQQCCKCHFIQKPTVKDIIEAGFWPGSPSITQGMYVYDVDMFEMFDLLKKEKPTLSAHSFLSTLEQISDKRKRMNVINPTAFYDALREWRRCHLELEQLADAVPLTCTACGLNPHAVHIDGNKKLYRYKNDSQFNRFPYTKNAIMCADGKVNDFVMNTRDTSSSNMSNVCGTSHFQAARTRSKGSKSLDETGVCTACCRHCVILRGLNMYQGEIFSYPLYLLYDMAAQGYTVSYMCQDVICKFWPWLQRLALVKEDDAILQQLRCIKPFLGVMHGKAHDWACQINWGGRWQDGSGAMSGEEMEMCFSYVSLIGHTTKMMTKSAREDEISEHIFHWNRKKLRKMTKTLASKYLRTVRQLERLSQENVSDSALAEQWKRDLQAVAAEKQGCRELPLSVAEETFISWAQSQEQDTFSKFVAESLGTIKFRTDRSSRAENLLDIGKEDCCLRLAQKLQDECSMLHSSVLAHTYNISKLADGCKQRNNLRRKRDTDKKALNDAFCKYNRLAEYFPQRAPILSEHETSGEWPWLTNISAGDPRSLQEKRCLVDRAEEFKRWKEEKVILIREMKNHVQHLKNQKVTLEEKRLNLQASEGSESGRIALLSSHMDRIYWLLLEATSTFQDVTSSFNLESSDEDEGSDEAVLLEDTCDILENSDCSSDEGE